jgi:hypothetical protein
VPTASAAMRRAGVMNGSLERNRRWASLRG